MKRMATIHKPFKYIPALHTDVRQTIRREIARLKALEEAKRMTAAAKVTELPKAKARQGSPG